MNPVDDPPEASEYLVSDPKKCTGCHSCMLTCSLAHEGIAQLGTSRILIAEDRFGSYPADIIVGTCRQCKDPTCLTACPVGAIWVDANHYNVRVVDPIKCTGCKKCIKACHFYPSRVRFRTTDATAVKCDLCRNTPHWEHEKGRLACVEVCPVGALASTVKPPVGLAGYEVNLRKKTGWSQLDLPTD